MFSTLSHHDMSRWVPRTRVALPWTTNLDRFLYTSRSIHNMNRCLGQLKPTNSCTYMILCLCWRTRVALPWSTTLDRFYLHIRSSYNMNRCLDPSNICPDIVCLCWRTRVTHLDWIMHMHWNVWMIMCLCWRTQVAPPWTRSRRRCPRRSCWSPHDPAPGTRHSAHITYLFIHKNMYIHTTLRHHI